MHQRLIAYCFACAFFAVAAMRGQAPTPSMPSGIVLVVKVAGVVTMTVDDRTAPLRVDDKVPATARILTGPASIVILCLANGATMQLGAESDLVLQEFLQQPFAGSFKFADLKEEPSLSRTLLALNRGELVGNVKRLKLDQGSSFKIKTAVGVADVSSGTVRIGFRATGAGQALFTLSTVGGEVGLAPVAGDGGANTGGAKRRVVQPGQEIRIAVGVTERGQLVSASLPNTTDSARPVNENRAAAATAGTQAATIQESWKESSPDSDRSALRPPIVKTEKTRPQLVKTAQPRLAILAERPLDKVKIGPMTVDAKWSNYGAYLQRMIDTVQLQWERILIKQKSNPVAGSNVAVKFFMNHEGRILSISVAETTANEAATRACVDAVTDRMPYGPWTDEMKAALGEKQEMTFTFSYQ